ncbi:MAG: hypothetical protein ABI569_01685 [Casimicrobiaceae bacterium]
MARNVAGVLGALIVWMAIVTLGNLLLRYAWADYAVVEKAMTFTAAMMAARLALGVLASLGAGYCGAWITRRNDRVLAIVTILLVLLFIPVHYGLWNNFPLWYHLTFFASLVIMTPLGARLFRSGDGR